MRSWPRGSPLLTGLSYENCRRDASGVTLRVMQSGEPVEVTADHLVSTAGQRANTEGLGLDEIGVETDARGSIVIGDDMQTSVPGIYAAGDVTDRDQFVYMAAYGAKLAVKNAVLGDDQRYDNAAMPWVVFSDPQVAGVGLSEQQARDAGFDVKTSVVPLDQVPRALGRPRHTWLDQACGGQDHRQAAGRSDHRARRVRHDPDTGHGVEVRHDDQSIGRNDLSLSDDGRGPKARGPDLRYGRRKTQLLRRVKDEIYDQ